jgi:putative MATE family efflux protein
MNSKEIFEKAPVPKAVFTLAVPTVLSMLVTIIYNMADTFFVGQTHDANQVAAVSLTMPVFMIFMAFGNLFGIGGSSYISRTLGQGDKDKVKNISAFCFYGCVGIAIIAGVISLIFMTQVLKILGASENTEDFARQYMTYISAGSILVVLANSLSNLIRSEGAAKNSMIGMMIGTIVNIVLDPIMILAFGMGVSGAAIATLIGNLCSIIYYVNYIVRKSKVLSISFKNFSVSGGIARNVMLIGIPASFNNMLMSLSNIILNNYLVIYGDEPVAAMGVAMKANMLVVFLQMGVAMGVQPILGYNFGSKNFSRMKSVMKFAALCTVIIGSLLTALYFFNTETVIKVFIDDELVIEHGIKMLKALMVSGPVLGIMFVFTFSFQAMGKAVPSLILSISRQGLVYIPLVIILNKIIGLNGLIYAQPTADIFCLVLSVIMFIILNRGFKKEINAEEKVAVKEV